MERYADRNEAGMMLAEYLQEFAKKSNVIVLALPRGGVPVGYEIATALSVPLDIFIVRKLGMPGHEELALGAIASGETAYFNEELLGQLNVPHSVVETVMQQEQEELKRRELLYRGERPFPNLSGKTIILVDDGMATGATMKAAIKGLRKHKPDSIIVAVPVAAHSTCDEMKPLVDKLVCPLKPQDFYAVGLWYDDFTQTTDEDVTDLLKEAYSKDKL